MKNWLQPDLFNPFFHPPPSFMNVSFYLIQHACTRAYIYVIYVSVGVCVHVCVLVREKKRLWKYVHHKLA